MYKHLKKFEYWPTQEDAVYEAKSVIFQCYLLALTIS